MTLRDIMALTPFVILAAAPIIVMLVIAFLRDHRLTAGLTCVGLALAAASLVMVVPLLPHPITTLLVMDGFALYFIGLVLFASLAVTIMAYSYFEQHGGLREEFYVLVLLGALGCCVIAASTHFAALFLGIELLSVSLYALAAYLRHRERSVEAGVKYLILAAVSSAFILFGMALIYADTGSMEFSAIARHSLTNGQRPLFAAGLVLLLSGLGFKLAVVPFHLWTPDVYEGAPAPVTAFIATASKGAVFAMLLRFILLIGITAHRPVYILIVIMAVASMFVGNLLALFQNNVKRILAYSSISHLGYLLVTVLVSRDRALLAAAFYVAAYFITTLGAFGVVTVLSTKDRDADCLEDYQGLAWKRPWLAGVLVAMLLSLAGMPLTAGFFAKFTIVSAGMGSGVWIPIAALVVNSVIGLYYYLRLIAVLFDASIVSTHFNSVSPLSHAVLTTLLVLLVWLGVYPGPMIDWIRTMVR